VEFILLILIVAASLTVCYSLWPWKKDPESQQDSRRETNRARFQKRLHIYIPSAANTFGILAISFMSGAIIPFVLGIAGYFLLATMLFMDFLQS
jgi:hypothetical protein